MRTPIRHVAGDGTVTWKVRYRTAGVQTSKTFVEKQYADTFAGMLNTARGTAGVAAALAWLQAVEDQIESQTFAQWFEHYVDQLTGVTSRTRADYRRMHARYLSELDQMPLTLINRGHVSAIVNRLDNQGLSAKTIKNTIHMLSSCLGLAAEEGLIAKNPCRRVRLPKPGHDFVEARFLEYHEFAAILGEIPEHYRGLVVFLAGTGLRWSEATALRPSDVSLTRGTVRVERAWKRTPGGAAGWAIGAPKSVKARRTVNAAVAALAAVTPLPKTEFLFVNQRGGAVRHNNFHARVWVPAVERAGLAGTRIHDLRHTHASWLISEGVALEAVQDQLGHESILTTRKVYGHLLPAIGVEVGRVASASLARALGQAVDAGGAVRDPIALEGPDQPHDPEGVAADGQADR